MKSVSTLSRSSTDGCEPMKYFQIMDGSSKESCCFVRSEMPIR